MVRCASMFAAALAATHPALTGASCASRGTYAVTHSTEQMEGGKMFCTYPSVANASFPLLSFEHGDVGGGAQLSIGYGKFLKALASSGFVVCAPELCPISCRTEQATHQLNGLVAAKALGAQGQLPIRLAGPVGIVGHSTGGMTTLKNSARDAVSAHSIGAAMVLNGDGGKELRASDNVRFEDIDEELPMFMVTGNHDIIEPAGSTESNHDLILAANPGQRLLTAKIDREGHLDPILLTAPLRSMPYIIAFFGSTLTPSDACREAYEDVLGSQLRAASLDYYDNRLFPEQSAVHV